MTTKVRLIGIKTERWQKSSLILPRGRGYARLRYWTSVVEFSLYKINRHPSSLFITTIFSASASMPTLSDPPTRQAE